MSLAAFVVVPVLAFAVLWLSLPSVGDLHARTQIPSTKILDRNGRLLYEIADPRIGHNTPLPLNKMPLHLRQAIIAVEDANFYTNPGVDIAGILRALWINIKGGEALAGGSTLTQQLARLVLLNPEERTQRTLWRKARESVLAWQMAQRYPKDEVLALYLNEAYFGNVAYGVEAAAQAYFGKSATELNLGECALLAGLPQSPVAYDPYQDLPLARKRQTIVLDLMVRNGFISETDARIAKNAKLHLSPAPYAIRAPHFVSYVRRWLEQQFGTEAVVRGGLIVTTTLDLSLNDAATHILRERLAQLQQPVSNQPSHNANNGALLSINPNTGEILAMVGSPNYFDASISGAVNATLSLRQPGSAIKPITYAAAFATVPNFTAATPILDVRTAFPTREGLPYVPVNYDRRNYGPISVRAALATSNNVAAVRVLQQVGLDGMLAQANAMGIHTLRTTEDYGLSLTLGGGEVKLLELTTAFGVFANAGNSVQPFAIQQVIDHAGKTYFRAPARQSSRAILHSKIAWLITDILADNVARAPAFGEGSVLKLSRPAAVKTGTTTDFRDNWTVGYTPDLVTGVWVGNADGSPMQNISGVSGAGPIWHDFMELAHKGKPVRGFVQPDGLQQVRVCALSGLLPTPACAHTQTEWFIAGTQPIQPDDWWVNTNGQTQFNLPPEAQVWARGQGWQLVSNSSELQTATSKNAEHIILSQPDNGTIYRISKDLPLNVQRIPLAAQVTVSEPDSQVQFVLSTGEVIAQLPAPFTGMWQMNVGEYEIFARVVLRDGRVIKSSPVTIRVLP